MDKGSLVEPQIADGKRLLDRLVEEGIGVAAACWLKEEESGYWYLYIATPLVNPDGATLEAYRRVNEVIRGMPSLYWLHPLDIKVIEPQNPIARTVQELHRRYPGASPVPFRESRIGDLNIEGAYVYPPIPAPVR